MTQYSCTPCWRVGLVFPQWRVGLVVLLLAGPAFGQSDARVPDPDPELERKTFKVAAAPFSRSFAGRTMIWFSVLQ